MKRILVILLVTILVVFISCQRELYFDYSNISEGTLKFNTTGDCLPASVNGTYVADSTVGIENYIEVQVDVTLTGTYLIQSDTVNGFSFKGNGIFKTLGLNTVRLVCEGKPVNAGLELFTITYGTSFCRIDVPVVNAPGASLFILGGSPANCSGFTVNGLYAEGYPLGVTNTATLSVNVIIPGTYTVSTTALNGMTFITTGLFATAGTQSISLTGSGTPVAAGNFNFIASNGNSQCTFSITVGTPPAALYTLGGAPNFCSNVVLAGNYVAGVALTAANTATIDVLVTNPGSYTITTAIANGVKFSKTGVFNTPGNQTVTLIAEGTPLAIATINHIVNGAGTVCNFSVNYVATIPLADYSLSGGPGVCSPFTLTGNYMQGVPLTAANTVVLQVNVVSAGTYTCNTGLINGISFTKSGVFTSTGIQNIILSGNGTPLSSGIFTYTPQTSVFTVCRFDLNVLPVSTDIINCKINGVLSGFNDQAIAISTTSPTMLTISGNATSGTLDKIYLRISRTSGTITAGTYTDTALPAGISIFVRYDDISLNSWFAVSGSPTPFTITITTINGSRAVGSFSGTLKDNTGAGPNSKIITAGVFDVPVN